MPEINSEGPAKSMRNPRIVLLPNCERWLRMFRFIGVVTFSTIVTMMFCPGVSLDLRLGCNHIRCYSTDEASYFYLKLFGFHLMKSEGVDTGCSRPPPGWNARKVLLTYCNRERQFSMGWRND